MHDKNLMRNSLIQADGLDPDSLSRENLESIQCLVEAHRRQVNRLRWITIIAWFVLLMVLATLLVAQNSHWTVDYSWLALDSAGFIVMTGLLYIATVSWYFLHKTRKNPPDEEGMRVADIEIRLNRIEMLLEQLIARDAPPGSTAERLPADQN